MSSTRRSAPAHVVITRPVGSGRALGAALRRHGAVPLWLPALSLHGMPDTKAVRGALSAGLRADILVFTSPAAVRFGGQLQRLRVRRQCTVIAVGSATAAALARAGVRRVLVPARQDSEGMLALAELHSVAGLDIAVIGAAGGRDLLQDALVARGACVSAVHVYRRVPARLDRRHLQPLCSAPEHLYVLVSSARTLAMLRGMLPAPAWERLRDACIVASSARVQRAARVAGFGKVVRARSANDADLLDAVLAAMRF